MGLGPVSVRKLADARNLALVKQWWCENNDEIMAHAEDYQATHNIYFSLATFPNRFNTREAKFVERICALWADVDRHENSIYKTDEEIEDAINRFLKSTGLPSPNIKHYTGYGMHIYWVPMGAEHADFMVLTDPKQ